MVLLSDLFIPSYLVPTGDLPQATKKRSSCLALLYVPTISNTAIPKFSMKRETDRCMIWLDRIARRCSPPASRSAS